MFFTASRFVNTAIMAPSDGRAKWIATGSPLDVAITTFAAPGSVTDEASAWYGVSTCCAIASAPLTTYAFCPDTSTGAPTVYSPPPAANR